MTETHFQQDNWSAGLFNANRTSIANIKASGNGIERGVTLSGHYNESWERSEESLPVFVLEGEEEPTGREINARLRDGQVQKLWCLDTANHVPIGVVDGDGRLAWRKCDGIRGSVVANHVRRGLETPPLL